MARKSLRHLTQLKSDVPLGYPAYIIQHLFMTGDYDNITGAAQKPYNWFYRWCLEENDDPGNARHHNPQPSNDD